MLMKRQLLIILFCAFAAIGLKAQPKAGTFSIIPRLGVTLANYTGESTYISEASSQRPEASRNYKPGLLAGLDFEYQITDILAASVGAYYSQQGTKYDDVEDFHDKSTKSWMEYCKYKEQYDYVNVPVVLSCFVAKNFALKLGVQLGFNTKSSFEYTATDITRGANNTVTAGEPKQYNGDLATKKVDFSIPVGVSYEYMNVILDARYNIGMTNINKTDLVKNRNSVFTFNVGYRFSL